MCLLFGNQRSRGKKGNACFANEGHLRLVSVTFGFHCGRWKARYVNKFFHFLKPRPNDRNMPTQHVGLNSVATCCVGMLRSFGRGCKFVMNFVKGVVSICHSFRSTGPGFSLQFFLWESLGLLQPRVEGPEVKVGGPTVIIKQRTRIKIKAVL